MGAVRIFMTGWWNLQWRRFMKFWTRASYKPVTVLLFRAFLAANFVGAVWYLIGQIVRADAYRCAFLLLHERPGTPVQVRFDKKGLFVRLNSKESKFDIVR
jgi:hypothetical protein